MGVQGTACQCVGTGPGCACPWPCLDNSFALPRSMDLDVCRKAVLGVWSPKPFCSQLRSNPHCLVPSFSPKVVGPTGSGGSKSCRDQDPLLVWLLSAWSLQRELGGGGRLWRTLFLEVLTEWEWGICWALSWMGRQGVCLLSPPLSSLNFWGSWGMSGWC